MIVYFCSISCIRIKEYEACYKKRDLSDVQFVIVQFLNRATSLALCLKLPVVLYIVNLYTGLPLREVWE